ncbi:AAT family amino acid transporter [Kwoniella heveanensis CBS 569]|nr:AAT family amino acid transporter [Kwoniella heveanensis CBS 569]
MSSHEYDEKKQDAYAVTGVDGVYDNQHQQAYGEGEEHVVAHEGLKRSLKSRHLAMISIGGVIGTGLFLGTGSALAHGGPLGLFLGYALMGSICYSVMICLGEMISFLPIPGGHIKLAERFVDPALSFTMGWNYWYNWVIILPAELSAAAVLINLWNKTLNNALWISICLIVVVVINLFGAGVYGECEFWFASIKVLTITGLIILGIILTAGGGPDHEKTGFRYWRDPGPFVQYAGIGGALGRFLGFWAVLTQAAFSYIGTEIVAIAAGEAKNPRRNLPRAIKKVYIRILVFYLGGTFIIGLLVPSNDKGLALNSGTALASPFVIAIRRAGIPALPSIINACLLTSAWSAASSDLFTSSRAIYGLAITRQAPKIFARTTKSGLPYVAIIFCALFGALAYMSLQSTAGQVFGYFANLTAAAGLMTWWGICLTYIRFEKGLRDQSISKSSLPYSNRLNKGAFAAKYAIVMITIILFFSAWSVFLHGNWDAATFITNYLPLWLFPLLFFTYKFVKKTKWVRSTEMDFVSDLDVVEAESYEEAPPTTIAGKIWSAIM